MVLGCRLYRKYACCMRHVELGHVLQICAAACNRKERRCAGASAGLSEPPTKCQGVS
jgi:hypothetical protein